MLDEVVERARRDPQTLGLILQGSHALGLADEESDVDLIWILAEGDEAHVKDGALDVVYTTPELLRRAAAEREWWMPALATSRVLLDKTGAVAALHAAFVEIPEDEAPTVTAAAFDAYLNSFYRSLKAWRRADELAGRIEAAESAMHLVRTLFALERRWAPYPKHLHAMLPSLAAQGWPDGYLERRLLDLVSTGDPGLQQELELRGERLLRERGFSPVVEAWGGEIERVSAFRF